MKKIFTAAVFVILINFSSVVAQWTKTQGPPGITITKFFENDSALFAGTYAQGVYKSYDYGNTWIAANTGIDNKQVLSLASDSLYIYAGTGDEGVYRSADQGATWTIANTGIQTQAVNCLLNAAGFMFAGTIGQGVYSSADHGNTWQDASGGALTFSFIHAMFYANSRLTVEADNYLFYSFDFGATWFVDNGSTAFYVIDNFLQKGDTVIASAKGNVFVTTDGGTNWSNVITVNTDIDILGLDRMNDTIYAGYAIGAYGGYANGVYRSTDWGQTWINISSSGLRIGNRYDNHFKISGNNFLISCEEIGIYHSGDKGATWTQVPLSNFEAASSIDNCILISGNTLYSGTHNDGVYSSTDNGNTWNKTGTTNPLDTLSNAIIFSMLNPAPNILLAGGCGYGLYRSANNGSTWTHIINGLPMQAGTGYCCVNSLVQSGSKTVAATTEGLYYSNDNGLTWNASNLAGSQVYASGLAAHGNVVVAGIVSFTAGDGIYRSTNGGVSWTQVNSILDVISMAAGGTNHFYAGTFNGNYFSNDDGLSWFSVGPGIPATDAGFAILAFDNFVFIGNNNGVYFSNNYAASFTNVSTGMDPYPNNSVQGLAADNTFIYAGMFIDAVWRRPLFDFGITTEVKNNISADENLLKIKITPNPAADYFTISYTLRNNSKVTIDLTDGTQRLIKHIMEESKSMGKYEITFSAKELPAGIYYLKIKTDDVYEIVKLSVIK
ncbi:MAG TPA: T9SS type A sorting domain-containing protein [Bacteroidia bacterium]|nr:T9SS type A sorting domain-containing protein [Bacteroidia bacterium]